MWVLFGILCFLVFGIPLIDDVYRLRTRRAANRAREMVRVPNVTSDLSSERRRVRNLQEVQVSHDATPVAQALKKAA
jgi:hypothetical protein